MNDGSPHTDENDRTHTCGNCGCYTAVIAGWAYDYGRDGCTPSSALHVCGEADRGRF